MLCVSVYLDARLGVVLSADWVAQWEGFELGESVAKGLNGVVISWQATLKYYRYSGNAMARQETCENAF